MFNRQKREWWRRIWKKYGFSVVSAVLGIICFISIYGISILNPTYDGWLLQGGDLTQHYIGWEFFRASKWQFPIGLMDRLCYPHSVSVIFTDSIPLFALIFKLLSPWLPETFQYFGFWALLCFILQGVFSANLLYLYLQRIDKEGRSPETFSLLFMDKNKIFSLVGSLFYIMAPIFLMKMFMHTALASQWLLTAGLYFAKKYVDIPSEKGGVDKKCMTVWGIMGMLCGSIHMYYIPLCGIILCGFLLDKAIKDKKIVPLFCIAASYGAGAVGMVLLLGGLSHDHRWDPGGLGQFSFNMNGFFNSMGWSRWLSALSSYGEGAGEGFSYLGLGILILLLVGISGRIWYLRGRRRFPVNGNICAYAFIVLVCVFLSASHKFALNGKYVFEIPYPRKVISLWGTFRASGRFIWPVIYLLMLWAMVMVRKCIKNNKIVICLLLIAFVIQNYDIDKLLKVKKGLVRQNVSASIIRDERWEQIAEGKKHIVFVSDVEQNQDILYSLCQFAYLHDMTTNDFYFAHSALEGDIENSKEESMEKFRRDTLYIFKEWDKELYGQYELEYYLLDGVVVGVMK